MKIAITFINFGTYHFARLRAANAQCARNGWQMTAIQAIDDALDHPWGFTPPAEQFPIVTLLSADERGGKARDEAFSSHVGTRMLAALEELQPKAVFLPGWSHPCARAGLQWCLRNGAHAIVMSESTRHDFKRVWWREAYKGFLIRSCDAALVGGDPHRVYLEELGMEPAGIFLGYDVVDNDYFSTNAETARSHAGEIRRQLDLPERYFLASSRFIEKKNLHRLIQAFDLYRKRVGPEPLHLVILGDGELRPQLENLVRERGLTDLVRLPGFAPYDLLPKYLGLATAFVHASTTEQWGLVVNEAMAAGLPVIVSDRCGCAPDLVSSGDNGYLIDPFDCEQMASQLLRVGQDSPNELASMAERSRARIAEWSPARFGRGVSEAVNFAASNAPQQWTRRTKQIVLASTASLAAALAPRMRGA